MCANSTNWKIKNQLTVTITIKLRIRGFASSQINCGLASNNSIFLSKQIDEKMMYILKNATICDVYLRYTICINYYKIFDNNFTILLREWTAFCIHSSIIAWSK